jgi:hypothetical protein
MAESLEDAAAFREFDEILRVCRSAVRKAQAESRRRGVANVYSFDGQLYYELPNGEFSRERPTDWKPTGGDRI